MKNLSTCGSCRTTLNNHDKETKYRKLRKMPNNDDIIFQIN